MCVKWEEIGFSKPELDPLEIPSPRKLTDLIFLLMKAIRRKFREFWILWGWEEKFECGPVRNDYWDDERLIEMSESQPLTDKKEELSDHKIDSKAKPDDNQANPMTIKPNPMTIKPNPMTIKPNLMNPNHKTQITTQKMKRFLQTKKLLEINPMWEKGVKTVAIKKPGKPEKKALTKILPLLLQLLLN